ncbi:hypothetical protein VTK56DRAFT_8157 [Thermocarpiscus australiensis]
MPTKAHHRSRSSIDRVFELLADLEENQIALLLDDLNHTTSSNVPVSEAIALFEQHSTKPRRKLGRSSSPVRTLQTELERRHSKRISSAPEPRPRAKTASQPPNTPQPTASPTPAKQPSAAPDRPSLTLSAPGPSERPKTSAGPSLEEPRPRSYKRISRPTFLSPTATAELHLLLSAYFSDAPVSTTTTATPSPATPSTGMSFSPFSQLEPEPVTPALDLLEPSPTRTPSFASGRVIRATPSMSSIFEVLSSH